MEADEVMVVEGDEPRVKRKKLTNFFSRLQPNSEPQKFPSFLKSFQPTDTLRRVVRTKRPVGRPKKMLSTPSASTANCRSPDENSQAEKGTARGVYKSYSLHQKLEIIAYAHEHTETEASRLSSCPLCTK